jgi:arsenite methyltransferase
MRMKSSGMSAIERVLIPGAAKLETPSGKQEQTKEAFGFKWSRRETYEFNAMKHQVRTSLFERYCGGDPGHLDSWLANGRQVILDAGCGAGLSGSLFFGEHLFRHDYMGVDISSAVEVARTRFAELGYPGDFLQADIMDLPFWDASIDLIFSEGVLHHTDDRGRPSGAWRPSSSPVTGSCSTSTPGSRGT